MTKAVAVIEGKKDGLRQSQDGTWRLTLLVHPNDMPPWLLTAAMGQRLGMVMSALNDDETPIETPSDKSVPFDDLPLAQQAGILCNDPAFARWLSRIVGRDSGDDVAEALRKYLGIKTRAELGSNTLAGRDFCNLVRQYRASKVVELR